MRIETIIHTTQTPDGTQTFTDSFLIRPDGTRLDLDAAGIHIKVSEETFHDAMSAHAEIINRTDQK